MKKVENGSDQKKYNTFKKVYCGSTIILLKSSKISRILALKINLVLVVT